MHHDEFYLRSILEEIEFLKEVLDHKDYEDFISDEVLKKAVVKTFENIGEFTRNLSEDLRLKHKDVEWRKIIGLRDILTHKYHGIDYLVLWDLYETRLDELEETVSLMLEEIEDV
ncbi:MAG: DUF86 domain-containing protein [Candidatus Thermoplasmatota archaeon]|nr:DUF86 domain-containing protein [Candidatus Thermoplasmatota archaeon]